MTRSLLVLSICLHLKIASMYPSSCAISFSRATEFYPCVWILSAVAECGQLGPAGRLRNYPAGLAITFQSPVILRYKQHHESSVVITGQDWRKKELQDKYRGFMPAYLQRKIDAS
jgi:hypothetical protein